MKNIRIKKQIKAKRNLHSILEGTKAPYYISVFRSNKHLHASVHDVKTKKALYGLSDVSIKKDTKKTKVMIAKELGVLFAKKMKENKHDLAVFHKGPYSYLGRVKVFVESLREGGIKI